MTDFWPGLGIRGPPVPDSPTSIYFVRNLEDAYSSPPSSYGTLTCDGLFSKLKSKEIAKAARIDLENPLSYNMVLVLGPSSGRQAGVSSSCTNLSSGGFVLSSLVSITEEQVDALGDEDLALIMKKFTRFYNN